MKIIYLLTIYQLKYTMYNYYFYSFTKFITFQITTEKKPVKFSTQFFNKNPEITFISKKKSQIVNIPFNLNKILNHKGRKLKNIH